MKKCRYKWRYVEIVLKSNTNYTKFYVVNQCPDTENKHTSGVLQWSCLVRYASPYKLAFLFGSHNVNIKSRFLLLPYHTKQRHENAASLLAFLLFSLPFLAAKGKDAQHLRRNVGPGVCVWESVCVKIVRCIVPSKDIARTTRKNCNLRKRLLAHLIASHQIVL